MDSRPSPGLWVSPPSFIFGCLWIAGAFAIFVYTFVSNYQNKPVSPAEEMAISSAALSPQHATAPTSPR
jgi:hypothetical protein